MDTRISVLRFFPLLLLLVTANAWVATNSEEKSWTAIASSADGINLVSLLSNNGSFTLYFLSHFHLTLPFCNISFKVAAENGGGAGGYIYTSNNAGYSWTMQTNSGPKSWEAVASSSNGQILYAAEGVNGFIWRSTDYGVNWQPSYDLGDTTNGGNYTGVACSSDGDKACGVATNMPSEYYADSTFSSSTSNPEPWSDISSSSLGQIMYASALSFGIETGQIFLSVNGGSSWSKTKSGDWNAIACDGSGNNAIAAELDGSLYITNNRGAIWSAINGPGESAWISVATSDDFKTLFAVVNNGFIWSSSDSGSHWDSESTVGKKTWADVATSANANLTAAVVEGGQIYTNFNCTADYYMSSNGKCVSCPANSYSLGGSVYTCQCDAACSSGSSGEGDSLVCICGGGNSNNDTDELSDGAIVGVVIGILVVLFLIGFFVWRYQKKKAQKSDLKEMLFATENPLQMEAQNDERASEKGRR